MIEYRRPIKYGENVTIQWTRDRSRQIPDVQIALAVGDDVRAAALLRPL